MLALVPMPPDHLEGSREIWRPFITAIAERSKNDPEAMERMLLSGEAQAFLVWDEQVHKAQAFIGVQYVKRKDDRVGQLIWLMGENRASWVHLFAQLEAYLKEHQGCALARPICRPGWFKILKAAGYRVTHYVMEKEL